MFYERLYSNHIFSNDKQFEPGKSELNQLCTIQVEMKSILTTTWYGGDVAIYIYHASVRLSTKSMLINSFTLVGI